MATMIIDATADAIDDAAVSTPSQALAAFKQFASIWERQATVRKHTWPDKELINAEKEDFPIDLLPFHQHPDFIGLDDFYRNRVLSCGWLAYNEKVINIKNSMVIPLCLDIYAGRFEGISSPIIKTLIVETMADEAYHIQLALRASAITRHCRELQHLVIPQCEVVTRTLAFKARHTEQWQKDIIQFAGAMVSETFVSGCLRALAAAEHLQPLSYITARAHLADELTHCSLFKLLTKALVTEMAPTHRDFFLRILPMLVYWFADLDLPTWESMLNQIGVKNSAQMLSDCDIYRDTTVADCALLVQSFEEMGFCGLQDRILEYSKLVATRSMMPEWEA